MENDKADASAPATLGRYRLDAVMGRGAMGSVYRAFDPVLGRQVAVKLMRTNHIEPELRAEFLRRFAQEVRAAAGCMHPAIVVVHDVGGDLVSGATVQPPFIVMELVEGGSLADRLLNPAGRAELSPQTVLLPILDALGMVHRLEIVHRDVKPANIMLTPAGQPKLTDFGISRLTHGIGEVGLTQTGTMIGTPAYMAPEQARSEAAGFGADLFSVGCILHEMLLGRPPFQRASLGETILALLGPDPVPLEPIDRLAPQYTGVLARALAKTPSARFASATEFAATLAAVPNGGLAPDLTILAPAAIAPADGPGSADHFDPEWLDTLGRELAGHLGPIAGTLVRRSAAQASDRSALVRMLATHLDDLELRSTFLRRAGPVASCGPVRGGAPWPAAVPLGAASDRTWTSAKILNAAQTVLVREVGPIAKVVVQRAAASAFDPTQFVEQVVAELGLDDKTRCRLNDAVRGD